MKTPKPLRLSLVVIAIIFATTPQSQPKKTIPSIEGTWKLTKYIPHDQGSSEWKAYGDSIVYQKHLTSNHFTWFKYDQKNNQLLGMGGGSYKIENGKYVEDIKFFYPPGSSELGQAIPFDISIPDDEWHHKGFAKVMEVDPESGSIIVVDSSKIEEKWVRTDMKSNQKNQLIGTWDLVSYREKIDGNYIEYPEYVGYIKLITPTHFTWVYFNKNDDEIYAAGSGSYAFNDGQYKETIEMIYPENTGQLGETIEFKAEINDNKWKHLGKIPFVEVDESTGNKLKTLSLIDEIWTTHKE